MKRYFAFAAALLTFAACQKAGTEAITHAGNTLKVDPVITRATEVNFETGDKIGLTVVKNNDTENYATNAELTLSDGSFSGSINWYADAYTRSGLYAYYPYNAEGVPTTVSVGTDQTAGIAAYDFMTAVKEDVLPVLDPVTMIFKHALTKIVVNVDNQTAASIQKVALLNTVPSGTYDPKAGTVTVSDAAAETIVAAKVSDVKYAAIVVPQTVAIKLEVTFNNSKIVSQPLASMELARGGQYTVDIRITEENMSVKASGEIQNWTDEGNIPLEGGSNVEDKPVTFEEFEGYFVYDEVRYNTVTFSNGQTWMAEALRFVPRGKTPSAAPSDGNGIWYPYSSNGSTCTALTDEASVGKLGYLYSPKVAFATAEDITADNYKTFEGCQGICPPGWHIPTKEEWVEVCADRVKGEDETSAPATNTDAVFYDADNNHANVAKANEMGFNFTFSGAIVGTTYNVKVIDSSICSVEGWVGANRLTYVLGSSLNKSQSGSIQAFSLMTTFTSSYPLGKLNASLCNLTNGVQVRCIKNAE